MNKDNTIHSYVYINDTIEILKTIPSSTIQLIIIDPPYNLNLAEWDNINNYMDWASQWIQECERILTDTGNMVIFGGYQYQNNKYGDLLEILYYLRHQTNLNYINYIIWYYKNGVSSKRFFSNRHEDIIWFSKTKNYYFNLDAVRIPYDTETKKRYYKDKRLQKETIDKGKNPTNVWEINRLNGNSKERVGHPTQKPKEIIERIIKALSQEYSTILDPFSGSCITGITSITNNRHSILIDKNPQTPTYYKKQIQKHPPKNKYKIHYKQYHKTIQ